MREALAIPLRPKTAGAPNQGSAAQLSDRCQKRQGTAALQNLAEYGRAFDVAAASWSAALPCRFSNDVKRCVDPTNRPKIARLKEGIRRFKWKWWALAILAILVLFVLGLFLAAQSSPLRSFAIKTNDVAGARWVDVLITNASSRTYSLHPQTEVMLAGKWIRCVSVESPRQRTMPADAFHTGNVLPGAESITYRFETPSESPRWRVRFFCFRHETGREERMRLRFQILHIRYPVTVMSEHTLEFGK